MWLPYYQFYVDGSSYEAVLKRRKIEGVVERTVGAALCGRPALNRSLCQRVINSRKLYTYIDRITKRSTQRRAATEGRPYSTFDSALNPSAFKLNQCRYRPAISQPSHLYARSLPRRISTVGLAKESSTNRLTHSSDSVARACFNPSFAS